MSSDSIVTSPSGSALKRSLRRWLLGKPAWVSDFDPNSLLVFVHIPKAAGTSVNHLLEQVYGRSFLNVSNHRLAWQSRRPDSRQILSLAGHFPYGWHRQLGRKGETDWPKDGLFEGRTIRYVAVVRDPVERFASYYRYARQSTKHRHYRAVREMEPREFVNYLDSIDETGTWNGQFRMLGGFPETRFHLVAPLEQLDGFADVLGRSLDWPSSITLPHSNQSQKRSGDLFDSELIEEIERRSRKDRELYNNVCERFARKDFPAFQALKNASLKES